ncbi:MAG: hypothetical protein IKD58_00145 [Loktanella sp.]|nr:hypothetical protein [Loktanella sp.]
MIASIFTYVIFGAAYYYASAARSLHASNDTVKAWLGFVPILNLWLIFAGPDNEHVQSYPRGGFSRFIVDPILVIGALLVLGLSQVVSDATLSSSAFETGDSSAFEALLQANIQDMSVEDTFTAQARLISAALPLRIDEITLLTEVQAKGRTLSLNYDISEQLSGFDSGFRQTLVNFQCGSEGFGDEIRRGGSVIMTYRVPDRSTIATYTITPTDCGG